MQIDGKQQEAVRNLVLVHEPYIQDRADLEAIAHEVGELAPDIEVFVASNDIRSSTTRKMAARRPTLVYCRAAFSRSAEKSTLAR